MSKKTERQYPVAWIGCLYCKNETPYYTYEEYYAVIESQHTCWECADHISKMNNALGENSKVVLDFFLPLIESLRSEVRYLKDKSHDHSNDHNGI